MLSAGQLPAQAAGPPPKRGRPTDSLAGTAHSSGRVNIAAALVPLWLAASFLLIVNVPPSLHQIAYFSREVLTGGLFVLLAAELTARVVHRQLPSAAGILLIPLLINAVALAMGSVTVATFGVTTGAYFLGMIAITEMRSVHRTIILLFVTTLIYGAATNDYFAVYNDGRVRLVMGFIGPNDLAQLCAILVLLFCFGSRARNIAGTLLLIVMFLSQSRATLIACIGVLLWPLLTRSWSIDGRLTPRGLRILIFVVIVHAVSFVTLIVLIRSGFIYSSIGQVLNSWTSGRLLIWHNAMSSVGLWGGVDSSVDWLRGATAVNERLGNRAPVDSYYVLRFLEIGLLFLFEYACIVLILLRARLRASKREMQLLVFVFIVGLVESTGIGMGTITAALFSSIAMHRGVFDTSRAVAFALRRERGLGLMVR